VAGVGVARGRGGWGGGARGGGGGERRERGWVPDGCRRPGLQGERSASRRVAVRREEFNSSGRGGLLVGNNACSASN